MNTAIDEFRIAYIIIAHKQPEQVIRLVERLDCKEASFLIHFDKRASDISYNQIKKSLENKQNVTFLKRRTCHWGDFGMVDATLDGMRYIINQHIHADMVMLRSGQDYPLLPNPQIIEYLKNNKEKSFISFFPLPKDGWENQGFDRINRWHFYIGDRYFVFPGERQFQHPYLKTFLNSAWSAINKYFPVKRTLFKGYKWYGGASWWCLSRESVEYIHTFIERNPAFKRFFKYCSLPDEMIFHTILCNSPLKNNLISDNLTYVDWIERNGSRPAILSSEDFQNIAKSGKLFARKFDMDIDLKIFDRIDRELLIPKEYMKDLD